MTASAHGFVGSHLQPFTELLPTRTTTFDNQDLADLATLMQAGRDTPKDGADPEENLWVPAGYTYFGQFVDHDLTFDSTSSLNPMDRPPQGSHVPTNLRTPRFDLDNVYGDGPDAQPFMYDSDGATILTGNDDLLRAPNGRAIIGDKRNDENSIICQIQLGMIRYHNKIVALLKQPGATLNVPGNVFASARNEVTWTYQKILIEDFLPRIIRKDVLADLQGKTPHDRRNAYALYTRDKRANLPREFVGAAYRYGHSGVRQGYRLNNQTILSIFPGTQPPAPPPPPPTDSLLGFDPLPTSHIIDDWQRFFPASPPGADIDATGRIAGKDDQHPAVNLQYAYKLDPTLVDPLSALPADVPEPTAAAEAEAAIAPKVLPFAPLASLALLNLLRGNAYGLATGQSVANALIAAGKPVKLLTEKRMVVRLETDATPAAGNPEGVAVFQWSAIPKPFVKETPLWLYLLLEAQAPIVKAIPGTKDQTGKQSGLFLETELLNGPGALSQLGWIGGRIVAEVFYGLLDEDPDSVFNHPAAVGFTPRLATGGGGLLCMRNLLDF